MATSTIPVDKLELLASQEDSYATTWLLYRYGRIYLLILERTEMTIVRPPGLITCPFNINPQWLPARRFITSHITQDSIIFNIYASPEGISGWLYGSVNSSGQMFAELTWVV